MFGMVIPSRTLVLPLVLVCLEGGEGGSTSDQFMGEVALMLVVVDTVVSVSGFV